MRLKVEIQKQLRSFRLEAALEAGDGTLGLLGASGCGKSMTLKCIAGIETPDEGHIELDGVTLYDSAKKIDLPPQQRRVGYLFQHYALFPNMTVRQNILCGLHREKDRAARDQPLREVVARRRLEGPEKSRPAQLSGGQQQRVALARILVNRPRLLLLDEPFSALDTHLRERLQAQLRELLAQYTGPSLLVTHNREEAYGLCGEIALMDAGRIVTQQETRALFADPGSVAAAAMTGCKNISPARRVGEHTLYAQDWGVTLQTALPLRAELCAVGVRAHAFCPSAQENSFPVTVESTLEEPFEQTVVFRYQGQTAESLPLWWRTAKDTPVGEGLRLGVAPRDVLPLYPE